MSRLIILFFVLFPFFLHATHNRGGFITYEHLSGSTYKIQVTTYTKSDSPADRCRIEISYGDGNIDTLERYNGPAMPGCSHEGELLSDLKKINLYSTVYTFLPGSYIISVSDPNRNSGVLNIPNSVNIPFYIETTIQVSQTLNNTPQFVADPVFKGFVNTPLTIATPCFDPEGDELIYELVPCRGINGLDVPGYFLPPGVSINPHTGIFQWISPAQIGEFNFAIKIKQYRGSVYQGYVIYDFQLSIASSTIADPHLYIESSGFIEESSNSFAKTSNPGDTITFNLSASSSEADTLSLNLYSELLEDSLHVTYQKLVYSPDSIQIRFSWVPDASVIRCSPHILYFRIVTKLNNITYIKDIAAKIKFTSPSLSCIPASVEDRVKEKKMTVYPNPFSESAIISVQEVSYPILITLFDYTGRIIFTEYHSSSSYELQRKDLKTGIYLLSIKADNYSTSTPIIIY